MMAAHRDTWGNGGGQNIAPTVRDKSIPLDRSHHRIMALFWSCDVDIKFGKGRGAFFREADKADIARIVNRLLERLLAQDQERWPPFAWGVIKSFDYAVMHRSHGVITLFVWLVRMMRDLATAEDMMQVENRFPTAHLLDGLHMSLAAHRRNLQAAGFGISAKNQMTKAKGRHAKPVTLPVPPANTQEEEDAA